MSDYAQGFKDGFAAGLEEGKKIVEDQWRQDKIKELEETLPKPLPTWPKIDLEKWKQNPLPPLPTLPMWPSTERSTCPKCGISLDGLMNYYCASPNCPTFMQTTCDTSKPMTAGVGDLNVPKVSGAGAAGSMDRYTRPAFDTFSGAGITTNEQGYNYQKDEVGGGYTLDPALSHWRPKGW